MTPWAAAQVLPAHYGQSELPPLDNPGKTILLLFSHGSGQEFVNDPCEMQKYNAAYGVPAIVHDLYGQAVGDLKIVVDGYCTPTRRGYYNMNDHSGDPKVMLRANDIEARARSFIAAGVPAKQIFLVGHSAGGWASLMLKARNPELANSVIAFAPAFAGQRKGRKPGWEWLHEKYAGEIQKATRLDAMVFAIENDAFETPEHLKFLSAIPGVTQVVVPDNKIEQVACDSSTSSHALVRNPCFRHTQFDRLKQYIEQRLQDAQ
ncbi:MAG: alpha/beta hydrolase [Ferrovibrio sp.]|uniref:alpha/beta fold hydrolase n=1 Tax=Ferrovibrio sp. TaxID=1917215 RepID=UPI00260C44E2|nr:alpha/beta hydrolase [Ferrovibrio sp.]MCW0233093.1 alpha/beta hydrolase [Ferrovibrio sp.]